MCVVVNPRQCTRSNKSTTIAGRMVCCTLVVRVRTKQVCGAAAALARFAWDSRQSRVVDCRTRPADFGRRRQIHMCMCVCPACINVRNIYEPTHVECFVFSSLANVKLNTSRGLLAQMCVCVCVCGGQVLCLRQ